MAQTKRDYYEILEVPRNATEEEIRKAYRKMAFKYHPDRNPEPGAAERFKEAKEAYEVLIDPEKRAAYDRYGHAGLDGSFVPGGFQGFGDFPFEDIFETFFGTGTRTRRQRVQRGADLRHDLTISFEEAVFGCKKEVSFPRHETCSTCGGTGVKPGSRPVRCARCGGTGEIRRAHQSFFGQLVNVSVCDACHGEGEVVVDPCQECRGQGRVIVNRVLTTPIPAGIEDGTQLRISGEGESGPRGGPPGDLIVVVHVQPHRYFRRHGNDLLLDLNINIAQAALGDEVQVQSLDGPVTIRIPPGAQHGQVIRVRGKGVPYLHHSGRGDLQVRLSVVIPKDLTDKQRDLLRQLAATFGGGATPKENKGFFDKVKDAFGV